MRNFVSPPKLAVAEEIIRPADGTYGKSKNKRLPARTPREAEMSMRDILERWNIDVLCGCYALMITNLIKGQMS
jgi:hypothetical protein